MRWTVKYLALSRHRVRNGANGCREACDNLSRSGANVLEETMNDFVDLPKEVINLMVRNCGGAKRSTERNVIGVWFELEGNPEFQFICTLYYANGS
jgi:hypothetical protein